MVLFCGLMRKGASPITFINCKVFRSADRQPMIGRLHLPVGQQTMSHATIGRPSADSLNNQMAFWLQYVCASCIKCWN